MNSLLLLAIIIVATLLMSFIEGRKGRKKWYADVESYFVQRMNYEFAPAPDTIKPGVLNGKIIFQLWRAQKLVTFIIMPDDQVCRYDDITGYLGFPIPDAEVTAAGKRMRALLQPLLTNGAPTQGMPIPPKDIAIVNWHTTAGWLSRTVTTTDLQTPQWQQIMQAEHDAAVLYQQRRIQYER